MTTSDHPSREASPFRNTLKALIRAFSGTETPADEPEAALSMDDVVALLGRTRRRELLDQLASTDQRSLPVGELAEAIACAEYDREPTELRDDERRRVYIALQQSHLPKLVGADVVTYDSNTKIVTAGPKFGDLWRAYTVLRDTR